MKGKLIIIPNKTIEEEKFELDITEDEYHLSGYQSFSDKYDLGYKFSEEEHQIAPLEIAEDGHLSLKTTEEESTLIFYLPEIITERQMNYVKNNITKFQNYKIVGSYSIRKIDQNIYKEEIMGLNNTLQKIKQKYEQNLINKKNHTL